MKNTIKIVKVSGLTQSFLGGNFQSFVALNQNLEFGFLPGETTPYTPLGGKQTLKKVLDILIFKPY